jgi:hypothetical protein
MLGMLLLEVPEAKPLDGTATTKLISRTRIAGLGIMSLYLGRGPNITTG